MSRQDISRFQRRAEEERERAAAALDPRLAREYRQLADKYDAVAKAYERLGA